jgi:predicted nucleic acid-binding protein
MSDIIIDANLIRNIAQGNRAAAEAMKKLLASGRRVYISQAAYNEVLGTNPPLPGQYKALLNDLGIKVSPASSAPKSGMITARGNVYADNMAQEANAAKGVPGPMPEYGGIRNPASGLKTRPADAFVAAEAKSLDAELWTLDKQFARQARQQGVKIAAESSLPSVGGAEDVSVARKLLQPEAPAVTPAAVPKPGFGPTRLSNIKAGFKAGLKGAFSPASIASMIPQVVLAIADKVAAQEAIKTIQVKFIKEGFAKGVAAGVMRWNDEEVASNLKNRITHFRVQGLGDAAGLLNMGYILQLAEAYENYAVDVGYYYCSSKPPQWKDDLRAKGYALLVKYGYTFSAEALFEYDFIDKLSWVLRDTTNLIVGPAIKFK